MLNINISEIEVLTTDLYNLLLKEIKDSEAAGDSHRRKHAGSLMKALMTRVRNGEQLHSPRLEFLNKGAFAPYKRIFRVGASLCEIYVEDGEVCFIVDRQYRNSNTNPKHGAAVLRAAIKEWKQLLKELPSDLPLYCHAYSGDDFADDRRRILRKLGFINSDNHRMDFKR